MNGLLSSLPRWFSLLAAVFALPAMAASGGTSDGTVGVSGPVVHVSIGKFDKVGGLSLGVVYNQNTLPPWGKPEEQQAAKSILSKGHFYQAIFLMGWGDGNPEPSPGVYDWSSLDRRIAIIRETAGIPVLNLCCAPDWMRGGQPGETDWKTLPRTAPKPEHFADFADLARKAAQRYPDVKYYQVWGELKGFWNRDERRWDVERYTQLYNLVYSALKAENPDIKVGGPYMMMPPRLSPPRPSTVNGPYGAVGQEFLDGVEYWLAHKKGADFIDIDATSIALDGVPDDIYESTRLFSDVNQWIRARTNLPIWWCEYYPVPTNHDSNVPIGEFGADAQNTILTATLIHMEPLASVALRWAPEGVASKPVQGDQMSLWSDTTAPGGGQPFPFATTMEKFPECFPQGGMLAFPAVSGPGVLAMASANCTLLVNERAMPVSVDVNNRTFIMRPYEVRFDAASAHGNAPGNRPIP
jgi:hypothetical protein